MDDRKEGVSASGNFLTYAQTALDTWNERPFCAVDSLVLSWLAYYRLPADCPSVNTWEGVAISVSAAVREGFYCDYYYELLGICEDGEAYARTSVTNQGYTTKVSTEICRYITSPLYTNIRT